VILRGGFGGSSVADELADAPVRHTLIKRANHHRFQPLLYELITAGFAYSEISATIRVRRGKQQHTTVLIGEAISIDPDARTVALDHGAETLTYNYCTVGTGLRHAYFGRDAWEQLAPAGNRERPYCCCAFRLSPRVRRSIGVPAAVPGGGALGDCRDEICRQPH